MPLAMTLDDISELDETTQTFYKKQGDKYVLDIGDGVSSHPEIEKLSSALKKERENAQELKKNLKQFKDTYQNIDPAKVDEMEQKLSEFQKQQEEEERKKAESKEQWSKLEKDLQEKHQQQLKAYEEKIQSLSQQNEETISAMQTSLEKEIKGKGIVSAIAENEGNLALLQPHVDPHVKVVEEDGTYNARVVDDKGQIRINDKGQPMSISELVSEMKQKPEFQGEGIFKKEKQDGGSGSAGNRGSETNTKNPWKKDQFNLTEQMKIFKEDPQLAERLKQEAGKGQ